MGFFAYNKGGELHEVDDRTLAHLRVVITTKLRRGESFMMSLKTVDPGIRWLWIHESIPVIFHFRDKRAPVINRAWIDELMKSANSAHGLEVVPEPPRAASAPT